MISLNTAKLTKLKLFGCALIICALCPGGNALSSQVVQVPEHSSAEHFGPVEVDYQGLLSSHDVVYLSPPTHGYEGLNLGDGEAGAMIWNPPEALRMQINHSSLWDDEAVGGQRNPANAVDLTEAGLVRYAADLEIQPGVPLFDWKYLSNYQARLDLFHAEAAFRAEGSLGRAEATSFYSHRYRVLVVDYRDNTAVSAPRRIILKRFGSRAFSRWYSKIIQVPEIGLAGTTTAAEGQEIRLHQKLGSLNFVVIAWILPDTNTFRASVTNRYQTENATQQLTKTCSFRLFLTIVHSDEAQNPLAEGRRRLQAVLTAGFEKVRAEHRADWANEWRHSFVSLPKDTYAENLWYLTLYQNIASRRGLEPPFFINGIWSWTGDVRAWGNVYLHWNMFSPNLALCSSGHADLMAPYFRWKRRQLHDAEGYARKVFGADGACFTDYASRRGEQTQTGATMRYNLTPGPQIAMEFYRYWQYTQDNSFLKEEALPFLRAVTRFYLSYLEKGGDGTYHVPRSKPYEFSRPYEFRDCLTDLSHIRWLLPALIDAETQVNDVTELSNQAKNVLQHLAPFQESPILPFWLARDVDPDRSFNPFIPLHYLNPFFSREIHDPGDRVYSMGYSLQDKKYVSHMDVLMDAAVSGIGMFQSAQTAPVYPCGLVGPDASPSRRDYTGASSAEIRMWEMGRNALRTMRKLPNNHPTMLPGHVDFRPDYQRNPNLIGWTGHSMELPAFARLGLAENLRKAMDFFIQDFQMYPQGLWCYWGWPYWRSFAEYPLGSKTGENIPFKDNPRMLHAGLEPGGIFSETVNEMLMTSYDGVIRLFPAYREDAAFHLAAVGGFLVTSRQVDGEVRFAHIESLAGRPCVISSPWPRKTAGIFEGESRAPVPLRRHRDRVEFSTEKGKSYVVLPEGGDISEWRLSGTPRTQPRFYGRTSLGKARDF